MTTTLWIVAYLLGGVGMVLLWRACGAFRNNPPRVVIKVAFLGMLLWLPALIFAALRGLWRFAFSGSVGARIAAYLRNEEPTR